MNLRSMTTAVLFVALVSSVPAQAGWKELKANQPAKVGGMTLSPSSDWNQGGSALAKPGVSWTQDGFDLNAFEVFPGVPAGKPLYKERDKKRNPMPKFDPTLLLPELADFFERSFRAGKGVTDFTVEASEPIVFAGGQGLEVHYRYSLPNDELVRRGIARLAMVDKKLYAATYYAPDVHYFAAGLPEAKSLMDKARF